MTKNFKSAAPSISPKLFSIVLFLHAAFLFCPEFFFDNSALTLFSTTISKATKSATQIRLVTKSKTPKIKKVAKKKVIKDKVSRKSSADQKLVKKVAQQAMGENSLKALYLRNIRSLIDQKKYYPRLSQKMGHTGEVVVSFTIDKSGKIEDMKVIKKCPFRKLNLSALKTLQKIASFNPIPQKLAMSSINVQIPIIYNLR